MAAEERSATVAIIGAGPAGLFAARELANNGVKVVLFNRDIKPGGLAEYGIYPEKYKLKDGLRAQFRSILDNENITYFGNVEIGERYPLKLEDLRQMGFAAILVTCGAQGTKWLGLPGETLKGVYHAKTLVLHYNHLPPYSTQTIKIGKKAIVVGVGNVMTDIVRYLAGYPGMEEITTIARRGPAEVKFDKKELEPVAPYLDVTDFELELQRVTPALQAIGQTPEEAVKEIRGVLQGIPERKVLPRWQIHFLYSPLELLSQDGKAVSGLKLEENVLELIDGEVKAKGTGNTVEVAADTVIFAIGDRVNDELGLPVQGSEFVKATQPKYPVDGISYELMDENDPVRLNGVFVSGWSRNASTGMVGIARKDGANAAKAVMAYLNEHSRHVPVPKATVEADLGLHGYRLVNTTALERLETAEKEQALEKGLPEYKFDTDAEMLKVMGL
jgi:ferredoxin--NADP+ reductase